MPTIKDASPDSEGVPPQYVRDNLASAVCCPSVSTYPPLRFNICRCSFYLFAPSLACSQRLEMSRPTFPSLVLPSDMLAVYSASSSPSCASSPSSHHTSSCSAHVRARCQPSRSSTAAAAIGRSLPLIPGPFLPLHETRRCPVEDVGTTARKRYGIANMHVSCILLLCVSVFR